MNAALILQILNIVIAGTDGLGRALALKNQIAAFQADNNRDPTDAEWEAMFAAIDADTARIVAADDRLQGQS